MRRMSRSLNSVVKYLLIVCVAMLIVVPSAAAADVWTPPQLSELPAVVLPETVKQAYAGQQLQVLLRVQIAETGVVTNLQIINSSGDDEFDQVVITVFQAAVFVPANKNGQAMASTAQIPIRVTVPELSDNSQ